VSRFRRRSEPSDVSLQKSKGTFRRHLIIFQPPPGFERTASTPTIEDSGSPPKELSRTVSMTILVPGTSRLITDAASRGRAGTTRWPTRASMRARILGEFGHWSAPNPRSQPPGDTTMMLRLYSPSHHEKSVARSGTYCRRPPTKRFMSKVLVSPFARSHSTPHYCIHLERLQSSTYSHLPSLI
jgi:hypothetical protein